MTIVNKPDFTLFASEAKTGEVDTFPNLLRGWGVTLEQTAGKPPMEWFNALQQRTDHWLMYLSQRGIPEWDSRMTYPLFAVVQHAGKFYVAKKESSDQSPDTSQNVWMSMAAALDLPAGSLTEKGMLQLSNAINSDSETMAATPKAVKAVAAQTLAKDQNGADIPDKLAFRETLGLMEAALRSVGTGENQLPDMSNFPNRFNVNGFQEFPGGLTLQWGQGNTTKSGTLIQFPTSFRHQCFQAIGSDVHNGAFAYGFGEYTQSTMKVWSNMNDGSGFRYVAIGY